MQIVRPKVGLNTVPSRRERSNFGNWRPWAVDWTVDMEAVSIGMGEV
jgi:hypothetical protein